MGKRLGKTFHERKIHKWPSSMQKDAPYDELQRKCKQKTGKIDHSTFTKIAKIKKTDNTQYWKGCGAGLMLTHF